MKEKTIADTVLCIIDEVFINVKLYYKLHHFIEDLIYDEDIEKPNFKNSININGKIWLSYDYAERYFLYNFPSKKFFINEFLKNSNNTKNRQKLSIAFQKLIYFYDGNSLQEGLEYCKTNKVQFNKNILNTLNVFKFLKLTKLTAKEKFLIYYYSINQKHFQDIIFITNSYSSFENKYYKFNKEGISTFFHGNLNNKYAIKVFDDKDQKLIKSLYQDGIRISLRQILYKLNTDRLYRGKSTVTITKLKDFLNHGGDLLKLDLNRNGTAAIDKIIFHGQRIQPKNPGSVYQIDGTRLNIISLDSQNKPIFYNILVVLDVFSKKVVGYKLTKIENFINYKNLLNFVIDNCGFIPSEIVMDNLGSFKSKDAELYFNSLANLGSNIRKHSVLNPQDKGHIENWFHIFGSLYLKSVPGYLGDGIKSKAKNGKPNEDLLKIYKHKSNFRSYDELNSLIKEKIKEYNNNYIYKNSNPQDLFINTAHKGITLNEEIKIYLFYQTKIFNLKKAYVRIQHDYKIYEYPLYSDNFEFFEKNYNQPIKIYFNPNKSDEIFLTSINSNILHDNYIKLHIHDPITLASVDQDEIEINKLNNFISERKKIKSKLKGLILNNKDLDLKKNNKQFKKKKIEILPIDLIDEKFDSKELVNNSNNINLISDNPNIIFSLNDLYKVSGNNDLIN